MLILFRTFGLIRFYRISGDSHHLPDSVGTAPECILCLAAPYLLPSPLE
jgi:hypothetical protein